MKDRHDASLAWCGTPSSIGPMKKERKQAGGQEAEKLLLHFVRKLGKINADPLSINPIDQTTIYAQRRGRERAKNFRSN
jgi:hypothetical protein